MVFLCNVAAGEHGRGQPSAARLFRPENETQIQLVSTEGVFQGVNPPALHMTGQGLQTAGAFSPPRRDRPAATSGPICHRGTQILQSFESQFLP